MATHNNNTIKHTTTMAKNASLIGAIGVIAIVQLIMMYYGVYVTDAFVYSLTAFIVVLNLITIGILVHNNRRRDSEVEF